MTTIVCVACYAEARDPNVVLINARLSEAPVGILDGQSLCPRHLADKLPK